ncbi:MAG: N-acetylmuramoyl-L-alanine amidase [Nocardia sp.]|uniref:peptidoglycan recognition protein family protein n=1 Tax=Nocardia sp. TaxID=1821 RepID=UPI0026210440|nr:peptidoglycan recognition family protein [Nocardia sp.]MCU1640195.1 N-acetylmuramoyl-L-alanine amidase [Nocardia sp.]
MTQHNQVRRRTLFTGAAAVAATGWLGARTFADAAPAEGTDCHGGLFTAVRQPDQTGKPAAVRFRVAGAWTDPVSVRRTAHGRDDRPGKLSEIIPIPAGADKLDVISEKALAPSVFAPVTAQPFRSAVSTSYAWGFPAVTRSGWGADESLMTWGEPEYAPAQVITVHHTQIPTGQEYDDYRDAVTGVYRFHALPDPDGQGWGDVGYHLMIDPNGVIYSARHTGADDSPIFKPGSDLRPGAEIITAGHVRGANSGNIGICLIGDFTSTLPSKPALHSLDTVLTRLCSALSLNPFAQVNYTNPTSGLTTTIPAVSGHRDWQSVCGETTCPGDFLHTILPLLTALSQLG